jgi:hypothetical protein
VTFLGLLLLASAAGSPAECRPPHTLKCDPLKWDAHSQVRRALVHDGMYWVWRSGIADRIITCESRFNPRAIGSDGELGLWQIHPIHNWRWNGREWYDPTSNTEVAIEIYRAAGNSFSPWSCY